MQKLGKICRHHRKERLNIRKIAKFESNLLKTSTGTSLASEDTAASKRGEILQTFE